MRAPGHHAPHDRPPSVSHTCSTFFTFLRYGQQSPLSPDPGGTVYFQGARPCAFPPPRPSAQSACSSLSSRTPSRHTGASRQPTVPASSSCSSRGRPFSHLLLPHEDPRFLSHLPSRPHTPLYFFLPFFISLDLPEPGGRGALHRHTRTHTRSLKRVCVGARVHGVHPSFPLRQFSHPEPFTFPPFFSFMHAPSPRTHTRRGAAEGLFHLPPLPLLHHSLACRAASLFCSPFGGSVPGRMSLLLLSPSRAHTDKTKSQRHTFRYQTYSCFCVLFRGVWVTKERPAGFFHIPENARVNPRYPSVLSPLSPIGEP